MNPPNYPNQYQPPGCIVYYSDPRCEHLIERVTQLENAWFNKQLQTYVQEEAFSSVIQCTNSLVVPGKNGHLHVLLDVGIELVLHILVDPIYELDNYYAIYMKGISSPLVISEKDFNRPSVLLRAVGRASGCQVRLYKSERHTGTLLCNALLPLAKAWRLSFYGGWKDNGGEWSYNRINGSTHDILSRDMTRASQDKTIDVGMPSAELMAAEQFTALMETITDPALRGVITLWFHAATLTTLLNNHNYRIAMGLCLYCADSKSYRHLCTILSWYGDPAITLSIEPKRFVSAMIERKDQPFLVLDTSGQLQTTNILLNAIRTGEIPPRSAKDSQRLALNSLPTVLSDVVSTVSLSRKFATIEVANDALESCSEKTLASLSRYTSDYLLGFNKYVETHRDELLNHVSRGIDYVRCDKRGLFESLDAEGMVTLGILKGIRQAILDYFRYLAASKELSDRFNTLLAREGMLAFINALSNAADSGCASTDLAESFVVITDRMLSHNNFDLRSRFDAQIDIPCGSDTVGIVYEDERYLYFTREAMQSISRACCISSPTLLRALQGADLLQGDTVNEETYLTRTTIYDNNSKKIVRVYKIERQAIDCGYN